MKGFFTYLICLSAVLFLLLSATSCRDDEFDSSPEVKLTFSQDTVLFDTVFTSLGSSTRELVVRNTGSKKINISRVLLAGGNQSPFRINVDGEASTDFKNLEIGAHDSAYIFVKVTIDPGNADNPYIVTDSILFETNGNLQNVKLVAWGQDAIFHLNDTLSGDMEWTEGKPHIIYGQLTLKPDCELIMQEGTRVFFHQEGSILVKTGANFEVNGSVEKPVTFNSDRLEDDYEHVPGLWTGIFFEPSSSNIHLVNTEIRNARIGLQLDTCGWGSGNPVQLHNCIINNMTNYGILATKSKLKVTNSELSNCGGYVVAIRNGGTYSFTGCTIARFFGVASHHALYMSNYIADTTGTKFSTDLQEATFANCIITGNQYNEIVPDKENSAAFNFLFDYCYVSVNDEIFGTFANSFTHCLREGETKFIDSYNHNFQLDTLSVAIDAASAGIVSGTVPDISRDLKGVSRTENGPPDLGAYERKIK